MMYKREVAVCFVIRTKLSAQSEHHVKKQLGFKRLIITDEFKSNVIVGL